MSKSLQALASDFSTTPVVSSKEMRRLFESDQAAFTEAAIALLQIDNTSSGSHYALALLLAHDLLLIRLCDPASFTLRQATDLAQRIQRTVDTFVDVKLVRLLMPQRNSAPQVSEGQSVHRALEILAVISDASRVMVLLTQLLSHRDSRVRSKVALLIGRINRNLDWADQRLEDRDERVRANTVESLWGMDTPESIEVFKRAARDPDNRVSGNGALGLYMAGDAAGAEALVAMICRPEPDFRSTAAWAMGETGDPRFLQSLSGLLKETDPEVRPHIFQAISKIRRRMKQARDAGKLQVLVTRTEDDESSRRLTVAINKDSGRGVTGLSPMNVIVADTGVVLHGASVHPLRAADTVVTGFVFPTFPDSEPFQVALLEAMDEFVTKRRRSDRWSAAHYHVGPVNEPVTLNLSRALLPSGSGGTRVASAVTPTGSAAAADAIHFGNDPAQVIDSCRRSATAAAAAPSASVALRWMINAMAVTSGQKTIYLFSDSSGSDDNWAELAMLARDTRVAIRAVILGHAASESLCRLCSESGGVATPVLSPRDLRAAVVRSAAALSSTCEIAYPIPKGSQGLLKVQVQTKEGFGEDTFVCG